MLITALVRVAKQDLPRIRKDFAQVKLFAPSRVAAEPDGIAQEVVEDLLERGRVEIHAKRCFGRAQPDRNVRRFGLRADTAHGGNPLLSDVGPDERRDRLLLGRMRALDRRARTPAIPGCPDQRISPVPVQDETQAGKHDGMVTDDEYAERWRGDDPDGDAEHAS